MKKLICILSLLVPLLLAAASLSLQIPLNPPVSFDESSLLASGYGIITAPGYPRLPYKQINVLLPPGAQLLSQSAELGSHRTVFAASIPRNPGYQSSETLLSRASAFDPSASAIFLGQKRWGDLVFASWRVNPSHYSSGSLSWAATLDLELRYTSDASAPSRIPPTFSHESFFANPDALHRWYQPLRNPTRYLVISPASLQAAVQPLIDFRQTGSGFICSWHNVDSVLSSSPGANPAEKLRNFLVEQYYQTPFKYLLLAGDVDTVPTAYLTPEPDGSNSVPSDFYYSDLSSVWDADNDGRLGEYSAGVGDQDWLVDYTPEVFVGRISTNVPSEVSAIAARIIAFEESTAPWKDKALLPAAFLNYQDEPLIGFTQTDGADFMQYLRATLLASSPSTTLYEQLGVVPSHPSDYPLDPTQIKNLLSTQSWGLMNWSAHGSSTSASRKIWMADTNGNNIPDSPEMSWEPMINRSTFNDLQNSDGCVVFAASCYNGMVDGTSVSLGEHSLIRKSVATIAATRTGWYKIGWQNPGWGGLSSYNYHWLENYRIKNMSVGRAQAYAGLLHTQIYLFGDPVDDDGIIWPELQNVYTYMLFGDPAVGHRNDPALGGLRYFIYEPQGSEGLRLQNALHAIEPGHTVVHSSVLIPVGYYNPQSFLGRFDIVFCLFGYGDQIHLLEPGNDDYTQLDAFVLGGGKLYLQGLGNWGANDSFWSKFSVAPPLDDPVLVNQIFSPYLEELQWDYAQSSLPQLNAGAGAFNILSGRLGTTGWSVPLAVLTTHSHAGSTIASSVLLSSVADEDYTDLIYYLEWCLLNGEPVSASDPVSPPAIKLASYPNPFNPTARVSYSLPSSGEARLQLFNLRGQLVRELISGPLTAGNHELIFDGTDAQGRSLPGGVYLLSLRQGSYRRNLKMVLLK